MVLLVALALSFVLLVLKLSGLAAITAFMVLVPLLLWLAFTTALVLFFGSVALLDLWIDGGKLR